MSSELCTIVILNHGRKVMVYLIVIVLSMFASNLPFHFAMGSGYPHPLYQSLAAVQLHLFMQEIKILNTAA